MLWYCPLVGFHNHHYLYVIGDTHNIRKVRRHSERSASYVKCFWTQGRVHILCYCCFPLMVWCLPPCCHVCFQITPLCTPCVDSQLARPKHCSKIATMCMLCGSSQLARSKHCSQITPPCTPCVSSQLTRLNHCSKIAPLCTPCGISQSVRPEHCSQITPSSISYMKKGIMSF